MKLFKSTYRTLGVCALLLGLFAGSAAAAPKEVKLLFPEP